MTNIRFIIDNPLVQGGAEIALSLLVAEMRSKGVLVEVCQIDTPPRTAAEPSSDGFGAQPNLRARIEDLFARIPRYFSESIAVTRLLASAADLHQSPVIVKEYALDRASRRTIKRTGAWVWIHSDVAWLLGQTPNPARPSTSDSSVAELISARVTRRLERVYRTLLGLSRMPKLRAAQGVICLSTEDRSLLLARGVRAQCIVNPVPAATLKKSESQEPSVVVIARLNQQKDLPGMLSVAEHLSAEVPSFSMDILGDGELRGWLRAEISRRGLEEVVALRGHVSDPDVYLSRAWAFLLLSHYEGSPMALIEALNAGLPCVVSDVSPGIRETLAGIDAGITVPEGATDLASAHLTTILTDRELRQTMSANAKLVALRHKPSVVAELWQALIKIGTSGEKNAHV